MSSEGMPLEFEASPFSMSDDDSFSALPPILQCGGFLTDVFAFLFPHDQHSLRASCRQACLWFDTAAETYNMIPIFVSGFGVRTRDVLEIDTDDPSVLDAAMLLGEEGGDGAHVSQPLSSPPTSAADGNHHPFAELNDQLRRKETTNKKEEAEDGEKTNDGGAAAMASSTDFPPPSPPLPPPSISWRFAPIQLYFDDLFVTSTRKLRHTLCTVRIQGTVFVNLKCLNTLLNRNERHLRHDPPRHRIKGRRLRNDGEGGEEEEEEEMDTDMRGRLSCILARPPPDIKHHENAVDDINKEGGGADAVCVDDDDNVDDTHADDEEGKVKTLDAPAETEAEAAGVSGRIKEMLTPSTARDEKGRKHHPHTITTSRRQNPHDYVSVTALVSLDFLKRGQTGVSVVSFEEEDNESVDYYQQFNFDNSAQNVNATNRRLIVLSDSFFQGLNARSVVFTAPELLCAIRSHFLSYSAITVAVFDGMLNVRSIGESFLRNCFNLRYVNFGGLGGSTLTEEMVRKRMRAEARRLRRSQRINEKNTSATAGADEATLLISKAKEHVINESFKLVGPSAFANSVMPINSNQASSRREGGAFTIPSFTLYGCVRLRRVVFPLTYVHRNIAKKEESLAYAFRGLEGFDDDDGEDDDDAYGDDEDANNRVANEWTTQPTTRLHPRFLFHDVAEIGDSVLEGCFELTSIDLRGLCKVREIGSGFLCQAKRLRRFEVGLRWDLKALVSTYGSGGVDFDRLTSFPLLPSSSFSFAMPKFPVIAISDRFLMSCHALTHADFTFMGDHEPIDTDEDEFGGFKTNSSRATGGVRPRAKSNPSSPSAAAASSLFDTSLDGSPFSFSSSTSSSSSISRLFPLKSALASVGACWLADCPHLGTVCFNGLSSLQTVGGGWMDRCVSLGPHVSFRDMVALRKVGSKWMGCTSSLRSVEWPSSSKASLTVFSTTAATQKGEKKREDEGEEDNKRRIVIGDFWLCESGIRHIHLDPSTSVFAANLYRIGKEAFSKCYSLESFVFGSVELSSLSERSAETNLNVDLCFRHKQAQLRSIGDGFLSDFTPNSNVPNSTNKEGGGSAIKNEEGEEQPSASVSSPRPSSSSSSSSSSLRLVALLGTPNLESIGDYFLASTPSPSTRTMTTAATSAEQTMMAVKGASTPPQPTPLRRILIFLPHDVCGYRRLCDKIKGDDDGDRLVGKQKANKKNKEEKNSSGAANKNVIDSENGGGFPRGRSSVLEPIAIGRGFLEASTPTTTLDESTPSPLLQLTDWVIYSCHTLRTSHYAENADASWVDHYCIDLLNQVNGSNGTFQVDASSTSFSLPMLPRVELSPTELKALRDEVLAKYLLNPAGGDEKENTMPLTASPRQPLSTAATAEPSAAQEQQKQSPFGGSLSLPQQHFIDLLVTFPPHLPYHWGSPSRVIYKVKGEEGDAAENKTKNGNTKKKICKSCAVM